MRDCAEIARRLDGTRLVSVMDRKADVSAPLAEQRGLGRVELVARAKVNRSQGRGQPKLIDRMRSRPTQGELKIEVERIATRRSRGQPKGRKLHDARRARGQLHWKTIELWDAAGAGCRLRAPSPR